LLLQQLDPFVLDLTRPKLAARIIPLEQSERKERAVSGRPNFKLIKAIGEGVKRAFQIVDGPIGCGFR